jgi:methionyl-tRNA formyltransferase
VTDGLSVVLIGSRSTVSVTGFKMLREFGIGVPLVISGDEDPGADDWRLSLAKAARNEGYVDGDNLFVLHNPHQPEILERIRAAKADLILSLQWRRILRPALCKLAQNGAVNLHNAPLPLLRGCDPFSWAIHDGLQWMGVTLHQVDQGVDTGPILAQRLWPITEKSTAWQLYLESLSESELLMRDALKDTVSGKLQPHEQASRYASYHPIQQFRFGDLEVDWNLPSTALSASLRARIFPPFQLPFFHWREQQIGILECCAMPGKGRPGEIIGLDPLRIASQRGSIEIDAVRVNGKEIRGAAVSNLLVFKSGESVTKQ